MHGDNFPHTPISLSPMVHPGPKLGPPILSILGQYCLLCVDIMGQYWPQQDPGGRGETKLVY